MGKRILLVDDEASIREALGKALRADQYEVVLADTGQAAIDRYAEQTIDLVLLDLNLPVKDGWQALEWLGEVNPLLPVIIITGRPDQRALAEKAGADALMEKPLDMPCLFRTVEELLNEPLSSRVQRVSTRTRGFRYAPCDLEEFREGLRNRLVAPFPCQSPHPERYGEDEANDPGSR